MFLYKYFLASMLLNAFLLTLLAFYVYSWLARSSVLYMALILKTVLRKSPCNDRGIRIVPP
jgi:hypothetical protein